MARPRLAVFGGTFALVVGLTALLLGTAMAVPSATPASTPQVTGGEVRAIAQVGSTIYIGGTFTNVSGSPTGNPHRYLAAIDSVSGRLVDGFDPQPNNQVHSLLATGGVLYAGGTFTTVRGCGTCYRLAKLVPTTGQAYTSFAPRPSADVWTLASARGLIWLGGAFASLAGGARSHLAAVSPTNGALSSFNVPVNGLVRAVRFNATQNTLYLGGSFTQVKTTVRYNFASVDAPTGNVTPWNPDIHAHGWGVALSPDSRVAYLTTTDGMTSVCASGHESIYAEPAVYSGKPRPLWHNGGDANCPFNSGDINAVEATSSAVYIGGHLTNLCTVSLPYGPCPAGHLTVRRHIAALSPATGVPLSWNPGATGIRGVLAIKALSSIGLGIGGDFASTGGRSQAGFALYRGTA